MIDIKTETLKTLPQASAMLPERPSMATLIRWSTKGVRGGRVLETVKIGGKVYTSVEAMERFAEQRGDMNVPTTRTAAARAHAITQAEKLLKDAGI